MAGSRQADKYIVRLPDGMRESIRQRAAANRRSMNQEIVHYLDRALAAGKNEGPAGAPTPPSPDHQQPPCKEEAYDEASA